MTITIRSVLKHLRFYFFSRLKMQHFIVLGLIAALAAAWRYTAVEPFNLRQHKI
jgi:hypothetical protein